MWCVKNPEWFDTVVTSNMFGDILTDLAAMIQGGLGVAASGNIHPGRISLFEPIHGSAPKHAGKNVANPIAAIMAVSMMLDTLGPALAATIQMSAAVVRPWPNPSCRMIEPAPRKPTPVTTPWMMRVGSTFPPPKSVAA